MYKIAASNKQQRLHCLYQKLSVGYESSRFRQDNTMDRLKQKISSHLDQLAGELSEVNRFIYEDPEIALQEKKTCNKLAEKLERYGFKVRTPVAGMEAE